MHVGISHRLQAPGPTAALTLTLLGVASLAGCAQQAQVTSAWQDDAPRNQSFARVLVVGVSPDLNSRCAFEHFMVSRIRSEATAAFASCDVVTKKEPLTRESIDEAIAAKQADAVLATILVSRETDAQTGGSRDTRGGAYYKATGSGYTDGYYGAYGVPVVYGDFQTSASITTIKTDVRVNSKFYETRGARLIYTLDTSAKNLESRDEGLAAIAAPIADRLRRDKLIR